MEYSMALQIHGNSRPIYKYENTDDVKQKKQKTENKTTTKRSKTIQIQGPNVFLTADAFFVSIEPIFTEVQTGLPICTGQKLTFSDSIVQSSKCFVRIVSKKLRYYWVKIKGLFTVGTRTTRRFGSKIVQRKKNKG